ncbi:magnesium/cobalt transporter CorA [Patescibacteria group bacterium]|nr:magnesium/cobalt transporter CorA [Patescibacteria group bacterium]MBU1683476.1 magnesium/cobalt transporter CorA [Patescibacteria group bacterium]MBU1935585.1 magnesium/cobalt transporter CorA [Patescibacteria group bacterium]
MFKFIQKSSKKAGSPPGELVHVGKKRSEKIKISLIDYDEERLEEKKVKVITDVFPFKESPTVTWINIDGLHDMNVVKKIGEHFDIHPLVLEDIVHTGQRPKMEDFEDYLFITLKMLSLDKKTNEIEAEQISLVMGNNFLISFQEREGDVFDAVRDRLKGNKGRIRKAGVDYLAYTLVDSIVDNYFSILENLGDKLEDLEKELLEEPDEKTRQAIYKIKREMIFVRKSIWPLREVINGLMRGDISLIQDTTIVYLKDVYDHTIQVIDTVETFRDMTSGMLDSYLSSISNKMNEVMKVLTIFAAIFIPLTFIAGVYGMNFEFMPELGWEWAYPVWWIIVIALGIGMVIYFKKKKWM